MKKEFEAKYHRLEDQHWWFAGRRHLVRELVRRAQADRGCRVLEIGCSGGMLMRQLRDDGYSRVTGIDISAEAIAQCARNGVADAHEMDAQRPDFPPESFDVITASDVLEHLADAPGALRAWHRLLRPGGVVMVFVPAFMFLWSEHDVANKHQRRYCLPELQAALAAAGFRVERSSYWNFVLFLPVTAVRLLKKLLPASREAAAHGDLAMPSGCVNALLLALLRIENRLMCAGVRWPWGVSAMVIARKEGA